MKIFRSAVYFFLCASFTGIAQPAALKFLENKNQWSSSINFAARTPGGRMFLSPGQFSVYVFDEDKRNEKHARQHGHVNESDGAKISDDHINGHHLQINFLGADVSSSPKGFFPSKEYYNFFLGNDSSTWASRVLAYQEIIYPNLYAGIDLRVSSVYKNLKYDFIVAPEVDPQVIQIEFCGADQLYLTNSNLNIETSVGNLTEKKPFTYQLINGQKCEVRSEYTLTDNRVSFYFPDGYDECYALVIDPLLIFSTFSGSTADNWGSTATPGENGTLYSSGITNHHLVGGMTGTFPATPGAFQTTYGGNYDIAIIKYDSTGRTMLYSSYLGGSSEESPHSLIMDAKTLDLIVMGTTSSFDFPVTSGALSPSYNGGTPLSTNIFPYPNGSDIILARISMNGDQLRASTYLGGSNNDGINPVGSSLVRNYGDEMRGDVITDTLGNIYISSVTQSENFPSINSFSTTYKGGLTDAVLVKINPELSSIVWSAFIGGSSTDASHTLKFDSVNNIYLAGGTTSSNFPVTSGAYQSVYAGNADGWIARVKADGSGIEAATFTGTSNFDQVYFVDLNTDGDVYVYGQTSGSFPITEGVYRNVNSGQFIQKISGNLNSLLFSTVFGSGISIPNISPTAFLVNECNNLYMAGWGGSVNSSRGFWQSTTNNMPVTSDALQKTTRGSDFYFMVLTGDAKELLYATYLGGNQSSIHVDGGTSRFDRKGIVYHAVCAGCGGGFDDFPTTPGAWSRTNNSGNCNNAAFKFDLSSLRARLQTNSLKFKSPGIDKVCFPDTIRFQNLSTGGEIFKWDLGDGTTLTKTDTTSFLHQYKEEGTYLVKLVAIDQNTCVGIDSVFKTIKVFKSDMKSQNDDIICFGTYYQLKASGGASYVWNTSTGLLQSTLVTPEKTESYFVTITDINGCIKKDTVKLEVVPSIDLQFDYAFVTDCNSRPQILLRNKSTTLPDESILLHFGDGFTSDLPEEVHAYDNDGSYSIGLKGIKEFCVYEKLITLPIKTLLVPNVITPGDADGKNDLFTIQYGEKGFTPAEAGLNVGLKVYNRWGDKVFGTSNYAYNWRAGDLDTGIYFIVVTLENQTVCKSWVHVVK